MGLINYSSIEDGTTIDASDVNTPLKTIYDEFNGSVDSNNIADDAVITAKIADESVTYSKLLATIFSSQIQTRSNSGTAGGTMSYLNLGGLKIVWGTTSALANVTGVNSYTVVWPTSFFSSAPKTIGLINQVTVTQAQELAAQNPSSTSIIFNLYSGSTNATATISYLAIE